MSTSAVLGAVLVLFIGGAQIQDLAPPTPPNGVIVLDKQKRARAILDVLPDGTPYLAFYDAKGLSRLRLSLAGRISGFRLLRQGWK